MIGVLFFVFWGGGVVWDLGLNLNFFFFWRGGECSAVFEVKIM
jgi:hypothetical protein